MDVFKKNGYRRHQGIKAFKKAENPKNKQPMEDCAGKVHLPYILGTIDKISYILKKNIKTSFKPMNTINRCLKSIKDPIDPKYHKGVYLVPCSCGKTYIRETGRSISTRIQEHVADIKHNHSKTSALAEHSSKTNHHICIENSSVVSKIDHYHHRKFREGVEIGKNPDNLNRDNGWKISDNWIPTLTSDSTFS